jgi:hypothetical protein
MKMNGSISRHRKEGIKTMVSKNGWYNDWENDKDERMDAICSINKMNEVKKSVPQKTAVNPFAKYTLPELKIQLNNLLEEIAKRQGVK